MLTNTVSNPQLSEASGADQVTTALQELVYAVISGGQFPKIGFTFSLTVTVKLHWLLFPEVSTAV